MSKEETSLCRICENVDESTEHVIECWTKGEVRYEKGCMDDIHWLKKAAKYYRRIDERYKEQHQEKEKEQ